MVLRLRNNLHIGADEIKSVYPTSKVLIAFFS
jgi:hypothetical protein